jgi:hypothetical protein
VTDWGEVDVLVEIAMGVPFLFVLVFSPLFRFPGQQALRNFVLVLRGQMSIRTLEPKVPIRQAKTQEDPTPELE